MYIRKENNGKWTRQITKDVQPIEHINIYTRRGAMDKYKNEKVTVIDGFTVTERTLDCTPEEEREYLLNFKNVMMDIVRKRKLAKEETV